jgi:phage baseplate assembly protein gpV
MTHRIRLAALAGILALAATACEHDPSGIATDPAPTGPATSPAASHPQGIASGGDGSIALPDANPGALTWYDLDGHRYDVQLGSTSSAHYQDGVLFATQQVGNEGATNIFADGQLVTVDAPVLYGGPSAARATTGNAGVQPPDLDATRDLLHLRRPRPDEPLRMKVMPCTDQIGSYVIASGELIAAGMYLQRHRGSRTAITGFTAALANWIAAWRELYFCMGR